MVTTEEAALREVRSAELRAERLSAAIRVVIFLVLLAVFTRIEVGHHQETYATLALSIYGAVAVVALVLAWRKLFHPALAYSLATIDVLLIATHLALLVRALGLPHAQSYAVPATGLAYLVLGHASLRFRPALVVYAGVLLIGALEVSHLFLPNWEAVEGAAIGTRQQSFLHQHALPISIIALMTLVLWAGGTETRRMLTQGIEHAGRAANLSRFFSPAVADRLAALAPGAHGERRAVAILFVDIHGFSLLGRTLPPDALAELLTEFRDVISRPVFELGGAIDKFIGDGALVLFGSVEPQADDADRALRCCSAILEAVSAWGERRQRVGRAAVRVGIGGHYGIVFVGVLGKGTQLEFTVIGDAVNMAERIERITREQGCDLVVSEDLLAAAGAQGSRSWRPLAVETLPGHGGQVKLFAARADRGGSPTGDRMNAEISSSAR